MGQIHQFVGTRVVCVLVTATLLLTVAGLASSQTLTADAPWFGVPMPPALEPHAPPVILGTRGVVPAVVPPGDGEHPELTGASIRADLETIVRFSRTSRDRREIGAGQLWGRITGFRSGAETVAWAVREFRGAGIVDTRLQRFEQDADASFWLPLSWNVSLIADPAFGSGSADVALTTAMPLAPSQLPVGGVTAPLVHVGGSSAAELAQIAVDGAVAVQHVTPRAHTVFERDPTVPRARALFERGALAVINVVEHPGNVRARDFSNCGGPCFNLGGRDGLFLETVMDRASEAGVLDRMRVQLTLDVDSRSGLSGQNGVAIIPGTEQPEEMIIVNAHADAWFDGAGDNGDGLAVLVALAKHFAEPQDRPRRTFVFVVSAGHHSPGLHGPRNFVTMNPELAQRAVLVLNIEHVAQRNLSLARSLAEDGYREFVADATEAPIVAGVSNGAPFLEGLFATGVSRYGVNFVSGPSTMASGEGGGYRSLDVAIVTTMQAPPLYHTSGEVLEVISTPGLERMARFLTFFLTEIDRSTREALNP